jgi:hypothetical protein
MESEIKEKLDTHDQVLDQIITQVEELGKRDYPDYKQSTADLKQTALDLKSYLSDVKALIDTLLAMKHKHTLDIKSKAVIVILSAWGLFTCLAVGLDISQHAENNTLKANSIKYRIIRQTYPIPADKADGIYMADPDAAEKNTIELEEKATESDHARDVAAEKEREAKAAREDAKALKKQTTQARKEALSGGKTNH